MLEHKCLLNEAIMDYELGDNHSSLHKLSVCMHYPNQEIEIVASKYFDYANLVDDQRDLYNLLIFSHSFPISNTIPDPILRPCIDKFH